MAGKYRQLSFLPLVTAGLVAQTQERGAASPGHGHPVTPSRPRSTPGADLAARPPRSLGRAAGGMGGLGLDLPGDPRGGPDHPAVSDGGCEIPDRRRDALRGRVARRPPATASARLTRADTAGVLPRLAGTVGRDGGRRHDAAG